MENKEIVNELIDVSFPILKKKKPKVFEFKIFRNYGFYLPIINIICISKRKNFSDKEKRGIFAHELCHAEQSNKKRFFGNIFIFISYWFFKKTRKKIEIQADKLVIKKGYAKELLQMTKTFEKEFGRKRYGLSSAQIKAYYAKRTEK